VPVRVELRSREGRFQSKNEIEFRLYRKFSTESQIVFDTDTSPAPEPLSDDQFKEEPAAPLKKP